MNAFSEHLSDQFERLAAATGGAEPGWMRAAREQAMACLDSQGLPNLKQEAWKYTNVSKLTDTAFTAATELDGANLSAAQLAKIKKLDYSGSRLVFVNGGYRADLSDAAVLPAGVRIGNLALELDQAGLGGRFELTSENSAFPAINTAFARDGVVVELPDNVNVEENLHLLFVSTPAEAPLMNSPRIILNVGNNSRVHVVEEFRSLSDAPNLTNAVTQIHVGRGAHAYHHRVQGEAADSFHVGRLVIESSADSSVRSDSIVFGGGLTRVDIDVKLLEPGAACKLNGLFVGGGEQHIDHHTCIDHVVGQTTSEESYRGILDERSRGVFNGKVIVREDAQRISARQSSDNLLLSRGAEIDTKPELEIYADDVACAHGATVGQLDSSATFYLQSRGVPEREARRLLTYAFAQKLVEDIPVTGIREWIEHRFIGHNEYSQLLRAF